MAVTGTPTTSAVASQQARPARGPYAKSREVQQRIVRAATEVFATNGYPASTFKEIARRSGVSERGLAYHFPTKEALLAAVMEGHAQSRSVMVTGAMGPGAFAAVLAVVAADAGTPGLVGLDSLLRGEATAPDHPAHEHYRIAYSNLRAYLSAAFAMARDRAEVTSDLSSEELAAGLVALLDGLQLQWLYEKNAVDVNRTADGYLAAVLSKGAMEDVRRLRAEVLAGAASGVPRE